MESYLEKNMLVYRKSYNYYSKISFCFYLLLKLFLSTIGPIGYFLLPLLTMFSLLNGIVEIFEKSYKLNKRIIEYRICYKFYNQLILLYKSKKIIEASICLKEADFKETINFFPREKHLKQTQLNGYKYTS